MLHLPSLYTKHASALTSILARLACPLRKLSNSISPGALHQKVFLLSESLASAIPYPNSQVDSNTHKSRILIEAGFHKLLEGLAVVTLKCWRVIFGDQKKNPHRMQVRIGRLSLC